MKLAILDPGYAHPHSHHESVNLDIHRSWSAKGAKVEVIASADFDSQCTGEADVLEMHIRPYFKTPCYPPNAENLPQAKFDALSQSFAQELINLYKKGELKTDWHLFMHTGFSFHIDGLSRAIWHIGG